MRNRIGDYIENNTGNPRPNPALNHGQDHIRDHGYVEQGKNQVPTAILPITQPTMLRLPFKTMALSKAELLRMTALLIQAKVENPNRLHILSINPLPYIVPYSDYFATMTIYIKDSLNALREMMNESVDQVTPSYLIYNSPLGRMNKAESTGIGDALVEIQSARLATILFTNKDNGLKAQVVKRLLM